MKSNQARLAITLTAAVCMLLGYTIRSAKADGVPSTMSYTGTLNDAAGAPISGTKSIGVTVWDAPTAGTKVCEAPAAVLPVSNGRFDVTLPATCPTAMRANPNLWIEVGVEGESLGRAKLGVVPYALEAGAASEAKGGLKTALDAVQAAVATKAEAVSVPKMTGWTNYTPVLACGGTPVAGSAYFTEGRWRREGDSIRVRAGIGVTGSPPTCASGGWSLSLPDGNVAAFNGIVGVADIFTNGAVTMCKTSSSGGVLVSQCQGSATPVRQEGAGLYNFTAGTGWEMDAVVPVQGWTTTTP